MTVNQCKIKNQSTIIWWAAVLLISGSIGLMIRTLQVEFQPATPRSIAQSIQECPRLKTILKEFSEKNQVISNGEVERLKRFNVCDENEIKREELIVAEQKKAILESK